MEAAIASKHECRPELDPAITLVPETADEDRLYSPSLCTVGLCTVHDGDYHAAADLSALLGYTHSPSSPARGLGVLTLDSQSPVVSKAAVIPAQAKPNDCQQLTERPLAV